jgi:hypothetical protein
MGRARRVSRPAATVRCQAGQRPGYGSRAIAAEWVWTEGSDECITDGSGR